MLSNIAVTVNVRSLVLLVLLAGCVGSLGFFAVCDVVRKLWGRSLKLARALTLAVLLGVPKKHPRPEGDQRPPRRQS